MTEHVCEWKRNIDGHPNLPFKCTIEGCNELMWSSEAERRINATSRLSAENARYYAENTAVIALRGYLLDYADILERKP